MAGWLSSLCFWYILRHLTVESRGQSYTIARLLRVLPSIRRWVYLWCAWCFAELLNLLSRCFSIPACPCVSATLMGTLIHQFYCFAFLTTLGRYEPGRYVTLLLWQAPLLLGHTHPWAATSLHSFSVADSLERGAKKPWVCAGFVPRSSSFSSLFACLCVVFLRVHQWPGNQASIDQPRLYN